MALGITLTIAAISVFLVVIGSQYSGVSVTRQCSIGNQCTDTRQFLTKFVPEPVAIVPLLMGAVAALGLFTRRMILAWCGTTLLLFFSILAGFSIGLYYLPFTVTLFGLIAVIQNDRRIA
jgi:hypothetical protein